MRTIYKAGLSLIAMLSPGSVFAAEITFLQKERIACAEPTQAREVLNTFAFESEDDDAVPKKIEAINARVGTEVCSKKPLYYTQGSVMPLFTHEFRYPDSPVEYRTTYGIVEIQVYGEQGEEGFTFFMSPATRYFVYFWTSARL